MQTLELPAWDWKDPQELGFADRAEAGRRLAEHLREQLPQEEVTIVGIPRGGVLVAAEIAGAFSAPLAVWVAQKLHAPHRPHISVGTVAEDGDLTFDEDALARHAVPPGYLVDEVRKLRMEVAHRASLFRTDDIAAALKGRHVVLVDDGIASGGTMRAAFRGVKHHAPASITIATPVAPQRFAREFQETATVLALNQPISVHDVGQFYRAFPEVTDEEILGLLGEHA
jgi:putative phosphoribosyl transferase